MKEILVISGKGGAGKTSVAASFAVLAKRSVIVDCDVDAADMHLLLKSSLVSKKDFYSGLIPMVDNSCIGCGKCVDLCRFNAISVTDSIAVIDELKCEGCGVCGDNCPVAAINMEEALSGDLMVSKTDYGQMVHARLSAGGENSGKLVAEVRKQAKVIAEAEGVEYIISDGPPGIGCPVIASLSGVDQVLVVTEATISGFHDMKRVLKLCNHFKIAADICINKSDINLDITRQIEKYAEENNIKCIGQIPYDKIFYKAQLNGEPVSKYPSSNSAKIIAEIWEDLTSDR